MFKTGSAIGDSLYFREVYSKEENRWFDLHSTRINWVDGRKVLLCTIYDVTDKKLYQQKIERQANNDFLTGLYNRMRCEQDLERYIRQTKEFGGEGALLYIDLSLLQLGFLNTENICISFMKKIKKAFLDTGT